MKRPTIRMGLFVAAVVLTVPGISIASDKEALTAMLEHFLATAHLRATHERFWSDDLVYTSSSGSRFGKQDILDGLEDSDVDAPAIVYSGDQVDVRLYGDTAVIAFRLKGTPANAVQQPGIDYYYNTGTFLKRNGAWRAVAWQATKIPGAGN